MPVTAIISFTDMSQRQIELASAWEPKKRCHSAWASPGETVCRDPMISPTGESSECCNMWIPHCTSASSFSDRHIKVRFPGTDGALYYIWQENQADGDFVRYSTTGYANPALPIPGSALVARDRDCGLTIDKELNITLWDPDPEVEIKGLPGALNDEHMEWHMADAHHGHTGEEFLQFHRDFLGKFRTWYDAQAGSNPGAVAPWPALPASFNQPGDAQASYYFDRIRDLETNLYKSANVNQLGDRIQGGVHSWLHHIPITTVNRDVLITNLMTSPRTRHFYELHGLIDTWWQQWIVGNAAALLSQSAVPSEVDPGEAFTVQVTFQNTGRTDWPAGGTIQLGSLDSAGNATWGQRRIALTQAVPQPQEAADKRAWALSTGTFVINATAPTTPGAYSFRWRLVDEAATGFGDPTRPFFVTVRTPSGQTTVPDVIGLSRGEAFAEIRLANLKAATTGGGNRVARQRPDRGSLVSVGTTVVCTLRGGPPDLVQPRADQDVGPVS